LSEEIFTNEIIEDVDKFIEESNTLIEKITYLYDNARLYDANNVIEKIEKTLQYHNIMDYDDNVKDQLQKINEMFLQVPVKDNIFDDIKRVEKIAL